MKHPALALFIGDEAFLRWMRRKGTRRLTGCVTEVPRQDIMRLHDARSARSDGDLRSIGGRRTTRVEIGVGMADPQHVPELDSFDELTVKLYRLGLLLMTSGFLAMSLVQSLVLYTGVPITGGREALFDSGPVVVICLGMAVSVASMHLYDKRIRWLIRMTSWLGLLLLLTASSLEPQHEHFTYSLGRASSLCPHPPLLSKSSFVFGWRPCGWSRPFLRWPCSRCGSKCSWSPRRC